MAGQQSPRPILVAGVAGGVGTSTLTRAIQPYANVPVHDLGQFRGGSVDFLVTSNTAAATGHLGQALHVCTERPIVVVMHTVPGRTNPISAAHLRSAQPHRLAQIDLMHELGWTSIAAPPGSLSRHAFEAIREAATALQAKRLSQASQAAARPSPAASFPSAPAAGPYNQVGSSGLTNVAPPTRSRVSPPQPRPRTTAHLPLGQRPYVTGPPSATTRSGGR